MQRDYISRGINLHKDLWDLIKAGSDPNLSWSKCVEHALSKYFDFHIVDIVATDSVNVVSDLDRIESIIDSWG